ncbi:chalcone-flavanone isomerase [Venturia nashicola]|uniref:Chalcone-flavanone isomerase n=1 Tax=Venturia nashicola TaxID=86259 RepID=A0A4Z1PN23_9PEZI|nr:chalcone-flavanone isomerase [Venturia nashicola]
MSSSIASRIASRRLPTQCLRVPRSTRQWTPIRHVSTKRKPRPDEVEEILKQPILNPADEIALDRHYLAQQAYRLKRMKRAGVGLALTVIAQLIIVYFMSIKINEAQALEKRKEEEGALANGEEIIKDPPAEKEGDEWFSKTKMDGPNPSEFQGKSVVLAPGSQKLVAHDTKTGQDLELVETGTSTIPHFPKTINLPSTSNNKDDTEYTLLGLGIRTVSFLSIQVYVVGFYIQTSSLNTLQSKLTKRINPLASSLVSTEKQQLRSLLLDGDSSYELWDEILSDKELNLKTAFRVVPTRNTDFGHLRDGFVRGITARTQVAKAKGTSPFEDESFGVAMKEFKALMQGKGSAPTGSVLLLTRDGDGSLGLMYQDKTGKIENFGTLRDERIARLLWLVYLGGKNVSSEPARQGVVEGIIDVVSRPLGSVETKVD